MVSVHSSKTLTKTAPFWSLLPQVLIQFLLPLSSKKMLFPMRYFHSLEPQVSHK